MSKVRSTKKFMKLAFTPLAIFTVVLIVPFANGFYYTFTNWDARPLTASQLRYAADDVRYLPLVWERLRCELESRGSLTWALRECELSTKIPARFDEESQVRRTLKSWPMKPAQIPVLRLLTRLRDEIARKEDLPHRVVMPDETMAEIVKQRHL